MLRDLQMAKAKVVDVNHDRYVTHHYKQKILGQIEKKEQQYVIELNKLQDSNDRMVSKTIPMLEYQLATVYSRWTTAGRAKALELDQILKASSIELEQYNI